MNDMSLLPAALSHDAHWAIYEPAARQLIEQLRSINAVQHRAEFEAARSDQPDSGALYDLGVEMHDGVAIISMVGPMLKAPTSFDSGVSTVRVRRAIRAAAASSEVKAIILRIDSPGGTVAGTADLAEDVSAAAKKKPCYCYYEDLGCSAAYWVGSQCTQIYANPTSIIGSIGTYMVVYDASGWAEKEGLKVHVIATGALKGAGAMGSEVTDEHLAEYQRTVSDLNTHFLNGVARGRGMSREDVNNVATGGVWVGRKAVEAGLVDGICSLDAVLAMAKKGGPKSGARAESTDTISGYADISPAGMTLSDESDTALAAVRGLTARLSDLRSDRQAEGRDLGVKARGHVSSLVAELEEATQCARDLIEDSSPTATAPDDAPPEESAPNPVAEALSLAIDRAEALLASA